MWLILFIYLFAFENVICEETESRFVVLKQGLVIGYKDPQEDLFAFYGIPYAKAPIGTDKFKAPLPAPTWTKPLNAVNEGVICPQLDYLGIISNKTIVKEDCLIANVYTPDTNVNSLPVVVYIHGGAFILGFGNLNTPKKIVSSKKVVAVTFNYRLAAHGFLCLGTKDIPGNAGMKDQVALLRWVKTNIKHFGGNPNDVTINGYSAGASSVGLLMISKLAKGLFHKIIAESGDITSPFSVQVNPISNAKDYAKLLCFNHVDDVDILESFFKNASLEILNSVKILKTDSSFIVTPCVEKDIGEERFLEDDPVTIIKKGEFENMPILYGFTNMDGLMQIDAFDEWKTKMNDNFLDFLPPDLKFSSEEERNKIANNIKRFYFMDNPVDNNNILEYVNYFTDTMFACPTLRTIKLLITMGNKNIYLYEYSYVDNSTADVPYTNVKGAGHCAQTEAILDGGIPNDDVSTEDFGHWRTFLREIWLNFMIKGKPDSSTIPEWVPVQGSGTPYMSLKKNPELKEYLLKERCQFWEEIYDKYYQNPVSP